MALLGYSELSKVFHIFHALNMLFIWVLEKARFLYFPHVVHILLQFPRVLENWHF